MAKPGKMNLSPEGLAKMLEAAQIRVERRTHGWLCYPRDCTQQAEWISRNTAGRGQKNNEAVAKRLLK